MDFVSDEYGEEFCSDYCEKKYNTEISTGKSWDSDD